MGRFFLAQHVRKGARVMHGDAYGQGLQRQARPIRARQKLADIHYPRAKRSGNGIRKIHSIFTQHRPAAARGCEHRLCFITERFEIAAHEAFSGFGVAGMQAQRTAACLLHRNMYIITKRVQQPNGCFMRLEIGNLRDATDEERDLASFGFLEQDRTNVIVSAPKARATRRRVFRCQPIGADRSRAAGIASHCAGSNRATCRHEINDRDCRSASPEIAVPACPRTQPISAWRLEHGRHR